jgi:hypothetical protein
MEKYNPNQSILWDSKESVCVRRLNDSEQRLFVERV